MLPSSPGDGRGSSGRRGLVLAGRPGRTRSGWLTARDTAGASAGSAVVGLAVSLGAHSSLLGVITGGAVWVASCAGVALIAWLRAFRGADAEAIDPWALPEPWRELVRDAVNAGRRFEVATASLPPGPLREHVVALEPGVAQQVRAVWETAQRGGALTGGFPPGTRRESASALSEQLLAVQEERSRASGDRLAELERAEAALALQLREAKRSESVAVWLQDGLRSAISRLEAAVTSVAELGGRTPGTGTADDLAVSLDSVGEQLAALQSGLREVGGELPPVGGLPRNRLKP